MLKSRDTKACSVMAVQVCYVHSSYGSVDILVIVCCITWIKLMSNNSYILSYCKVAAVYSVVE